LSNQTLIVYLNDNGGAGWSSANGGNYSYNTPLRGYKGASMVEGSIRVPAVARWTGTIPGGQAISTPVISLDFMATFVSAGGNAPAAARNGLEGINLLPLLRDGQPLPADRVLCWRAGGLASGGSAARMGTWKILADNVTGNFKLYDLAADIRESTDASADHPAIFHELKERFRSWNAANIEPFYGAGDMVVDAGLERGAINSGYRIHNRSSVPAYLTAPLRYPFSMSTNFSIGFHLRPAETNHAAGAQLWFVLGDGTNRASHIGAGVDFGQGMLRLRDGKGGGNASVSLPALPTEFAAARLDFEAASRRLTFTLGGTNVSLIFGGNYGVLATYGCGAAAMEGEVTQPFGPAALPAVPVHGLNLRLDGTNLSFKARFPGDPVSEPKIGRAKMVNGAYEADSSVLVEYLGGGLYRFTAATDPRETSEFFRISFNQP
jgi:hypothetical protein